MNILYWLLARFIDMILGKREPFDYKSRTGIDG